MIFYHSALSSADTFGYFIRKGIFFSEKNCLVAFEQKFKIHNSELLFNWSLKRAFVLMFNKVHFLPTQTIMKKKETKFWRNYLQSWNENQFQSLPVSTRIILISLSIAFYLAIESIRIELKNVPKCNQIQYWVDFLLRLVIFFCSLWVFIMLYISSQCTNVNYIIPNALTNELKSYISNSNKHNATT